MFDKNRLLDIIKNFILFTPKRQDNGSISILWYEKGYKFSSSCSKNDGRAGVIWHTRKW